MDRIFIEGLEVDTVIGVYDWERTIRQCLRIDVVLGWDIREAAAGDDLTRSLDYAAVAESIAGFAANAAFQLVETFAERLADHLITTFGLPWLRLRIGKPGAVPTARLVGVEIERGRP